MNPESPINPRQALESSLTALLLGELPPDQAEFLHRTMTQDPELAKTYERLKRTIELVQETAATPVKQPEAESPPLKMSEDRRQELLQHFKTAKPREFARPRQSANTWVLTALAAVLIAFLGIAMLLPA
ncbi:MAG TPA: hypothetical protein VEC99_04795, partial [Clostridia bacterium]|nr:hypothetical protein [Clostridia bacterium]